MKKQIFTFMVLLITAAIMNAQPLYRDNNTTASTNAELVHSMVTQSGAAIGIGTTAPSASVLEVLDNGISTTNLMNITSNSNAAPGSKKLLQLRANMNPTGMANRFNVDRLGKTGINVSSPVAQFEVQAYTTAINLFQARNSSGVSLFCVNASGFIGIGSEAPAIPIDVKNGSGTKLLQLTSEGNLGIGNISPTYRLDINCQQSGAGQPPFRFVNYLGNTTLVGNNNDRVGINITNPDLFGGSLVVGAIGTGANALDLVSTSTTGWCNQLRFYNASAIRHIIADDRTNNYLLIKTGNAGGAANKLRVEGNQDLIGNLTATGTGSVAGKLTAQSDAEVNNVLQLGNGGGNIQPLRIGDRWVFSNGTSKYIGYNVQNISSTNQYITNGAASSVVFNDNGSIWLSTAPTGIAGQTATANPHVIVNNDGAVAISRTNASNVTIPSGSYSLYVDKGILTEKVKVALMNGDWSDYVFDKSYNLLSLNEVESYIKENKHLPHVPGACEVEQNGIDLGQMDATLLRKIEELTLYVIALEKEVKQLKLQR